MGSFLGQKMLTIRSEHRRSHVTRWAVLLLLVSLLAPLTTIVIAPQASAAVTPSPQAQALWEQVKDEYNALTYSDAVNAKNTYIGGQAKRDATAALQAEGIASPSEDQIRAKFYEHLQHRLALKDSFDTVKAQFTSLMPRLIEASNPALITAQELRDNKAAIALGIAYMNHYYGFSVGGERVVDRLFEKAPEYRFQRLTPLALVKNVGKQEPTALLAFKTADLYGQQLKAVTGQETITAFIKHLLATRGNNMDPNEWLRTQTPAVIDEVGSTPLFAKFDNPSAPYRYLRNYLLPLMALKSSSVYVGNTDHTVQFGLTSTYGGVDGSRLRPLLRATLTEQQAFWDFWSRISTTFDQVDQQGRGHVIVIDTMKTGANPSAEPRARWSPQYGATADEGVRDFFTPLALYSGYKAVQAYATGKTGMNYYMQDALGQPGVNTYTHELTHIYDETIWFNGHGRRPSTGPEDFARGLYETENNTPGAKEGYYTPYFSLNTAYELGEGRIQNASPTRFQQPSDIQEYMRGLMDVLYSLDAMEARSILKQSSEKRAIALNKVTLSPDSAYPGASFDTFARISVDEAARLTSIDDLIDLGAVSGRLLPKGRASATVSVGRNDYVVVPLFEPVYAGLQNDAGNVGGFLLRRYAHELLAEYGWEKGLIGYVSDQYQNDGNALAAILSEHGGSLATFKKAMFERRVNKLNQMAPIPGFADAQAMQAAMDEAVAADIAQMEHNIAHPRAHTAFAADVLTTRALKQKILQAYVAQTKDFQTSIYSDRSVWETPIAGTVTLHEATVARPFSGEDFTVQITERPDNTEGVYSGVPETVVKVANDGRFDLGTWTFTQPGRYEFTLRQVPGKRADVTHDPEAVTIVVHATAPTAGEALPPAENGIIRLKPTLTFFKNNVEVDALSFVNTIKERRAVHAPEVSVTYQDEAGASLSSDAQSFAFTVAGDPANDTAGHTALPNEQIPFVQGRAQLPAITFTKAGTYVFRYTQVAGNKKGVTYDTTPIVERLEVTPSDIDPAAFTVTRSLTREDAAVERIEFHNRYTAPTPPPHVPVEGEMRTTTEVAIPIEDEFIDDPEMFVNTTKEIFAGIEGRKTVTTVQRTRDGVPYGEAQVSETVTVPMQKRQIARGIKPIPVPGEERTVRTEAIPVANEVILDPQMLVGTEEVVREGEAGEVRITTIQPTLDGKPVGEAREEREELRPMQTRQIKRGTKALLLVPAPKKSAEPVVPTPPVSPTVPTPPVSPIAPTPPAVTHDPEKPGESSPGKPGEKLPHATVAPQSSNKTDGQTHAQAPTEAKAEVKAEAVSEGLGVSRGKLASTGASIPLAVALGVIFVACGVALRSRSRL